MGALVGRVSRLDRTIHLLHGAAPVCPFSGPDRLVVIVPEISGMLPALCRPVWPF